MNASLLGAEEEEVTVVASQVRGYGVWDGGVAQGGALLGSWEGPAPSLLFLWVTDAQANLLQMELSAIQTSNSASGNTFTSTPWTYILTLFCAWICYLSSFCCFSLRRLLNESRCLHIDTLTSFSIFTSSPLSGLNLIYRFDFCHYFHLNSSLCLNLRIELVFPLQLLSLLQLNPTYKLILSSSLQLHWKAWASMNNGAPSPLSALISTLQLFIYWLVKLLFTLQ